MFTHRTRRHCSLVGVAASSLHRMESKRPSRSACLNHSENARDTPPEAKQSAWLVGLVVAGMVVE